MALSGTQYQSMRLKFRGLLSNPFWFVSEAELDSFIGQLAIDSTSGAAVTANQKAQADSALVGALTAPAYAPTAADLPLFFTQLATSAPVIITALTPNRYQQLKSTLTAALSIAGIRTEASMLGYMVSYIAQGPLGILGSAPSWWLDCSISTIVDAGGGVASSSSDASGNGVTFTYGAGARPTINATGLNGKKTLAFTTAQFGGNSGFVTPAPGTTPSFFWAIYRPITTPDPAILVSVGPSIGQNIYTDNAKRLTANYGSAGGTSAIQTAGTWYRAEILVSNSAADYLALNGSSVTTGLSAGNTGGTGVYLNASNSGATGGNFEFAEIFQWINATPPTAPQRAALAAYSLAKWGI